MNKFISFQTFGPTNYTGNAQLNQIFSPHCSCTALLNLLSQKKNKTKQTITKNEIRKKSNYSFLYAVTFRIHENATYLGTTNGKFEISDSHSGKYEDLESSGT
jgi:hypothetical protein